MAILRIAAVGLVASAAAALPRSMLIRFRGSLSPRGAAVAVTRLPCSDLQRYAT